MNLNEQIWHWDVYVCYLFWGTPYVIFNSTTCTRAVARRGKCFSKVFLFFLFYIPDLTFCSAWKQRVLNSVSKVRPRCFNLVHHYVKSVHIGQVWACGILLSGFNGAVFGPVTMEPFRQQHHKTIHFPLSPLADASIQSNL